MEESVNFISVSVKEQFNYPKEKEGTWLSSSHKSEEYWIVSSSIIVV